VSDEAFVARRQRSGGHSGASIPLSHGTYEHGVLFCFGSSLGPIGGGDSDSSFLLHVLSVVKWLNRSVLRNKGPYRDLDGSEDYLTRISKVVVKAISSSLMRS
jgi:hypothetical protein